MLKKVNLLFILMMYVGNFIAQTSETRHFSTEKGLPSSQIYKVLEDKLGHLWFLTDMGISKYDGYSFENFNLNDGLSENVFLDATVHEDGTIWFIGVESTITKMTISENIEQPIFEHYAFNDSLLKYKKNTPVTFKNIDGDICVSYVGTYGYLRITKKGKVKSTPTYQHNNELLFLNVMENGFFYPSILNVENHTKLSTSKRIVQDHITRYQAFRMPGNEHDILFYANDSVSICSSNTGISKTIYVPNIIDGGIVDSGTFWISSIDAGVRYFNLKGEQLDHFFQNRSITDHYQDKEGNIWCSTLNNGVYLRINSLVRKFVLPSIEDQNINFLAKGSDNKLFISHYNGNVSTFEKDQIKRIYTSKNKRKGVVSFLPRRNELLYMSDRKIRSLTKDKSYKYTHSQGFNLKEFENGNIGVCAHSGIFIGPTTEGFQLKYHGIDVRNFIEFENRVWMVGRSGLNCSLLNDTTSEGQTRKLYSGRVNDILEFGGSVLIATHGNGVMMIDTNGRTKRIVNIQGLDFTYCLYKEDDKTIWACTNSGLFRLSFDPNTFLKHTVIDSRHGLLNTEVRAVEIIGNRVWIGTRGGLFYFDKRLLDQKNGFVDYALRITSVGINKQNARPNDLNNLAYNENNLEFAFSGISFKLGKRLQYRYKLKGLEKEWNYTTERRAIYPNLIAGEYEFLVQVKGENGNWSDQTSKVLFTVSPPFWKTWWFKSLIAGLVILLVYLFFKFRILLYNRDLVRELMRHFVNRLRRDIPHIIVREGNKEVKIPCHEIKYIKSSGNYLEIHHDKGKTLIRHKISQFLDLVPDPLEYVQVRRSYIVRLDRIDMKSKKEVVVSGEKIKIGETFIKEIEKIEL